MATQEQQHCAGLLFHSVIIGEVIRELRDPKLRPGSHVYDMCVDRDLLIIPRYQEKTILVYKMKYYD